MIIWNNKDIKTAGHDDQPNIGVREIFCQGGAVNHLPKKILTSVPNFYITVEKKRGPYCNNIGHTGV